MYHSAAISLQSPFSPYLPHRISIILSKYSRTLTGTGRDQRAVPVLPFYVDDWPSSLPSSLHRLSQTPLLSESTQLPSCQNLVSAASLPPSPPSPPHLTKTTPQHNRVVRRSSLLVSERLSPVDLFPPLPQLRTVKLQCIFSSWTKGKEHQWTIPAPSSLTHCVPFTPHCPNLAELECSRFRTLETTKEKTTEKTTDWTYGQLSSSRHSPHLTHPDSAPRTREPVHLHILG